MRYPFGGQEERYKDHVKKRWGRGKKKVGRTRGYFVKRVNPWNEEEEKKVKNLRRR